MDNEQIAKTVLQKKVKGTTKRGNLRKTGIEITLTFEAGFRPAFLFKNMYTQINEVHA